MQRLNYEVIIGLEVHAQLNTGSKLFCSCPVEFKDEPNRNVCPVCLGLPGVLPVLNQKAVELAIRTAVALNCQIARRSRFTRKHYFYPDLPKGYQITQYTEPLGYDGFLDVANRHIRIKRLIVEEDAGKSIHTADETLVDFNRCGVPLIEITTEPDLRSPDEVIEYLSRLRQILQYLLVSEADMEKGQYRCEPNISLRRHGVLELGVRTEVKNLNSLRNVKEALEFEIRRQAEVLDTGGSIVQETLLWDDARRVAEPMRSKEETADYRYFPEPDLPPLEITEEEIIKIKSELPELPAERRERFIKDFSLPPKDADVLTASKDRADYYEAVVKEFSEPKFVSNWVITEVLAVLNEKRIGIGDFPVTPQGLSNLLKLIEAAKITSKAAKTVFAEMVETGSTAEEVVKKLGLEQVADQELLARAVAEALKKNPDAVEKFKKGKTTVVEFLLGEVMRQTKGKLNVKPVREYILKRLNQ
jgi:aspartyl-tRNA(Asn)/glutamyl-tRNA(Gln) amidotransferase subunit B